MVTNASNENLLGAASYLLGFVTGIAMLVLEKKSQFVRFHAMQSTVIFVLMFVVSFVPLVGLLSGPVSLILWLVLMWKAFNGEKYKLPYIGDFAEKQLKKIS